MLKIKVYGCHLKDFVRALALSFRSRRTREENGYRSDQRVIN